MYLTSSGLTSRHLSAGDSAIWSFPIDISVVTLRDRPSSSRGSISGSIDGRAAYSDVEFTILSGCKGKVRDENSFDFGRRKK